MRLFAIALAAIMLFPGTLSAQTAKAVVTDIRVGAEGETTRLVFDLNNKVAFSIFTLSGPYRVVIDLPEVGWRLPPRPLPANIGILEKLRYGLFRPGTSRIVLDVNRPPTVVRSFLLNPEGENGYRLVVDLGAVSQALAVAGPQPSAALFTPPGKKPKPDAVADAPAKRIIVIDPGHGGVDPGAIGISGIYEKHITLAMAREFKEQLEKTGRFKVSLTRSRDVFVPLRERVNRAREAGAELFLSLHADAIKNRNTRGLSVYTLSERASDREAAALAEKENKADLIAGIDLAGETPEVTNILIDLAQRESMNQSAKFAAVLVKELRHYTRVLRNTHRFAGFAVLKAPDLPSVLVELGFLSNRNDEKALRDKKYRAQMAQGMVRAVSGFFSNIEEAYKK